MKTSIYNSQNKPKTAWKIITENIKANNNDLSGRLQKNFDYRGGVHKHQYSRGEIHLQTSEDRQKAVWKLQQAAESRNYAKTNFLILCA